MGTQGTSRGNQVDRGSWVVRVRVRVRGERALVQDAPSRPPIPPHPNPHPHPTPEPKPQTRTLSSTARGDKPRPCDAFSVPAQVPVEP